ncbi:hypothetical protein QT381_05450 [Galbitalea sp. SE-J8]|uniref:hypothetical protein n=1 Tax=Galbitalea sp. SE-J8 TaxID=3054952 RepID=UPI00259CA3AB|nr:hypothetical protein [Galbitalea sp. SE-J8]MDM4762448.1 hypothetical protein [Galbitalea sp. SE-J8]
MARSVELDLPRGWRELPPASVLAGEGWIFEWIEESNAPAGRRAQLAADLRIAASFALARARDGAWLLVTDPDDFSVVHGLASLRVQSAEVAADERAAAEFAAASGAGALGSGAGGSGALGSGAGGAGALGAGAVSWLHTVALATVGRFPAEVVHEFAVAEFPAGADVIERCVTTVFPDVAAHAVQLELDAHSVGVYDDIVAVALGALAGIRFADPA